MLTQKTNTIALFALLFALCSGALYAWVFYEVMTSGQSLTERVATIADTRAKERAYKDLALQVANTASKREALNSFVLTEDKTGTFLTEIEALGTQIGVKLTTTSLKVEKKKDLPDTLQVQFSIEGNELSVKKMLTIFETLPYHSVVQSVTFTKEGGSIRSSIDLKVTLF
jgi:hypothetical protein